MSGPSSASPPASGAPTSDGRAPAPSRRGAAAGSAALVAVLLGVLSGLLCLVGAGRVSLWKDETDSISASTRSLGQLWHLVHHIDAVHGLYYAGLHLWIDVFGRSPLALRGLSALAIAVATAGVYVLGRRMLTPGAALVGAVAFAVLPRVTWAGIETRSFAWTAALAVWSGVLLVQACERRRTGWWVGYAVLGAVAVIANVYLALALLGHGVTIALRPAWRRAARAWLASVVVSGVLASPVAWEAVHQRGQLGDTSLGVGTLVRSVVINQWFLGNTPTPNGQASGSLVPHSAGDLWRPAAPLLALVGWVVIIVGIVVVVRRRRGADDEGRLAVELLVPWVVLPTVLVAAYSVVATPMYSARYFTFCAPAIALLLGFGLTALARRWLQVVAAALVVVLVVPIYVSQRRVDGKGSDWSAAAAYVQRHREAGQAVYFAPRSAPTGPTVTTTLRYVAVAYPAAFRGLRDLTLISTGAHDGSLNGESQTLAASVGRLAGVDAVWVVRRRDYPARLRTADDELLTRAGFVPERQWQGRVDQVVEYTRR